MKLLDSTSEADGDRSIRCWKFFLLHFKEDKSTTKYALEALYLLLEVYSSAWNRNVNNKGGPGKNVAIDLGLEYDNNDLKQPIKDLRLNIPEDAAKRIQMDSKSPNKCFLAWTEKFLSSKGQASTFQLTTQKI